MKRLASCALAAALLTTAGPARADKPRCRLERIDPSEIDDGKIKVYASVLELEGTVDEVPAGRFVLRVDGRASGKPQALKSFASAKEEVDVALVVETAAQYKKVLDRVRDALQSFLQDQPATMKVTLIAFGSDLGEPSKPLGAPMMSGELDKLSPDDDSVDVRMTDAVLAALGELKKAEPKEGPPPRRLIVLVSDGLNAKMDRATFKRVGDTAARAGVPIHAIAFSPIDERGPLLNLGELSKRSNGTFRWAKTADEFDEQLKNLAEEVRKQYVLTFKSPVSSTEKHVFQLSCGEELLSNRLGGKGQIGIAQGAAKSGLAWYWWLLIVLGALIGIWIVAGVVLTLRGKATPESGVPRPAKPPRAAKVRAERSGGGAQAAQSATLTAVTGPLAGQRFAVGAAALTIGKGADNALVVEGDGTVSTHHCQLGIERGAVVLRDLGSTNGTWVNGRKVEQPVQLRDGDLIRLGTDTQFKLRIG